MRVFCRTLCVINCHFAAHVDAVARRNADFEYVYRNMTFSPITTGVAGTDTALENNNFILFLCHV